MSNYLKLYFKLQVSNIHVIFSYFDKYIFIITNFKIKLESYGFDLIENWQKIKDDLPACSVEGLVILGWAIK